ncbi:hypothetical protein AVEN_54667-1 [Araneus ventricosus]|uniref:ATP-dependent DNA helicase PIF1 n=1 Tax=Araneus ventricosus TaxID=182803 RepID=A0A4Y2BLE3_ARAVE|nr:hypothetical protein AVEN_54667-1 [Araneus ventricosus]
MATLQKGTSVRSRYPISKNRLWKCRSPCPQPISIHFPAKYYYGTAERRMLPLILPWASTVHKMQGCTVDYTVIYLGSKLFKEGQAYVVLSRVKSMDGLIIEDLDCSKLTGKKPCNVTALAEMDRMRNIELKSPLKSSKSVRIS